ncbi:MAG: regulatory protein [Actinomycetota bacterium]|jgi:regulatory protein|nr:regulatory protein [Actinomycetota bacterium]
MDPLPLDTSSGSNGNGHSCDGADRVSERGQYKECMARAGHLLARRSRSRNELEGRLIGAGFEPEIVAAALGRLGQLGLVDDAAFARSWIDERAVAKGYGAAKLVAELEAKGVDHELARQAVSEIDSDEIQRAAAVALKLAPRVAHRPLAAQASALAGMLLRRGFGGESTEAAVRSVLPPEGWD